MKDMKQTDQLVTWCSLKDNGCLYGGSDYGRCLAAVCGVSTVEDLTVCIASVKRSDLFLSCSKKKKNVDASRMSPHQMILRNESCFSFGMQSERKKNI